MTVPVIDLFAGPGGLGEGFSRARSARFEVAVSIEKDGMAFETLQLRAAHRALSRLPGVSRRTWRKWEEVLTASPWNIVFEMLSCCGEPAIEAACRAARREAWHLELGPANRDEVSAGIRARLQPYMRRNRLPDNAVLIGGPPCQAYSIVGRSRNKGTRGYRAENDSRHFLYREYLHVIGEFRPAVFVMENVKGILSSTVQERGLFQSILEDLRRPDLASGDDTGLEYELIALAPTSAGLFELEPEHFIVEAEQHGVPQARHRVIICGVRKDVYRKATPMPQLGHSPGPAVKDVIGDLPPVRCALSYRGKGTSWAEVFDLPLMTKALRSLEFRDDPVLAKVARQMEAARKRVRAMRDPGAGADRTLFGEGEAPVPAVLADWYQDRPLSLLANHESRAHMPSDLVRYLFLAAYGKVTLSSPKLHDFPVCLLPEHRNVDRLMPERSIFKDRFRVQVGHTYSTTVTSHIAKDGHAFIHYDAIQCRSLTVREAARLQTFPDSYVFLGSRTSQYTQVGNAVPPYLAYQIAQVVGDLLQRAGLAGDAIDMDRNGLRSLARSEMKHAVLQ